MPCRRGSTNRIFAPRSNQTRKLRAYLPPKRLPRAFRSNGSCAMWIRFSRGFFMIVNPEIERYMHELLPARDSVLAEMEATAAKRNIPIIGPAVARLLAQLVMISGAKRIFELG